MDANKVVVIGASLGGLKVVEYLRKKGFSGEITLVGDEAHLPYDRPPLSKKIIFDDSPDVSAIALRQRPWEELNVSLMLSSRVVEIDTQDREIVTEGGDRVAFDALFIATGVEARELPGQDALDNVFCIRRWEDSIALRERLVEAENVVVVGGGFIGTEVAAASSEAGKNVTLIDMADTILVRGLGSKWGAYFEALHRKHGVDIRTASPLKRFVCDGSTVTAVELEDGNVVDADVVVVGIGATPETGWIEASGIDCNDGVLCDEFCETNVPGVYAVGDVARWNHVGYGKLMRVEHWTNADEMAKAAVENFLCEAKDERKPFTPVPMVWSDQFGLRIQVAGEVVDVDEDSESTHFGTADDGEFVVIQQRDGDVSGVLSVNRASVLVRVKMLLERGAPTEKIMAFVEQQEARFLKAQAARAES